jgi:hypothetical protein
MNCLTCGIAMTGRKKKYCQPSCRPSFKPLVNAGLDKCQACGKSLLGTRATGRPKRNCDRLCSSRFRSQKKRKPKQKISCLYCSSIFETNRTTDKYCSIDCRTGHKKQTNYALNRYYELQRAKYPDGTRTHVCGWCGELRTFIVGQSVVNAFHDDCRKQAIKAKNRTKTVKRTKGVVSARIAPEQVVLSYGDTCHICKETIDLALPRTSRFGLTIDHVIPLAKGGLDTLDNLKPAHWICNIKKSDKSLEELNAKSR